MMGIIRAKYFPTKCYRLAAPTFLASPCGNGFFNVEISYLRTVYSDGLKLIYSVIDDALPSILDKPKSVPQISLKFQLVNRRWHKLGPEQDEDAF